MINTVKLSTQQRLSNSQRLCVRLDLEALGLKWAESDTIRTSFYKDGRIVLRRVGGKYAKQASSTLTKTSGGACACQLGVYIRQTPRRFASLSGKSVVPAVRVIEGRAVEMYIPKEMLSSA